MRKACLIVLAALLAGCGDSGGDEAAALADEALAEASRANSRADELEQRLEELESDLRQEANDREMGDANLQSEVSNHTHYY